MGCGRTLKDVIFLLLQTFDLSGNTSQHLLRLSTERQSREKQVHVSKGQVNSRSSWFYLLCDDRSLHAEGIRLCYTESQSLAGALTPHVGIYLHLTTGR